ncbi:hypothetical protein K438DRAFT_1876563 [Mycena galopus ATCC 62051]|nr:hypothetical protein K438DRAFT_1876563 [Mycena galopus ATCC 62051]
MAQGPDHEKFRRLWEDATKKYEDDANVELATHPLVECNDPDAVLDVLDGDLQKFKKYRRKKERFRNSLKPLLHIIGSLSETAGEVVGVVVPFAKAGFVALGVLVQAAENVSERYDRIKDLCERLCSMMERVRVYSSSTRLPNSLREVVIRMLAHLLSIFALMRKEMQRSRIVSYLRVLIRLPDVEDALKIMDNLVKEEQSMGVANIVVFAGEILDHVHEDERQKLATSVRSWLKAPDAQTDHNTARSRHTDNTGSWLVRSDQYESWKSTSSSFFWISGKPGAGKTILCSTIIKDISVSGNVLGYFYFYNGDPEKQTLRGMLSSIIFQLDEQLHGDQSPLLTLYKELNNGSHQPSIPQLSTCLERLIIALSPQPIFIVLDALDECSSPHELAPILRDFCRWGEGCVHVLVTSRPEDAVINVLHPLATCKLPLSSVLQHDISVHLDDVVSKADPFYSWEEVHWKRARDYLVEHSDGMFRWVTCQVDELRECLVQDLEATLEDLPATLDATYERILSRIHGPKILHARRLFNWLAFSFRPLKVEELVQVLAIKSTEDANATFESPFKSDDPMQAITLVCRSLVQITPDGTVQFAHFTVKEFLMSNRIRSASVAMFWIEAETAHAIIAASCLAYLLWAGHRDTICGQEESLKEYSVQYAVHAQFGRVAEAVHGMLASLFQDDCARSFWVWNIPEDPSDWMPDEEDYDLEGTPLYWAANFGFINLVQMLLNHGANVDAKGGKYGTPFRAAFIHDHAAAAWLLLEHHPAADVDLYAPHPRYGTMLQEASYRGCVEMVKLLVEKGADVNVEGNGYGTALHIAAFSGQLQVVQFLFEREASVNAQRGRHIQRRTGANVPTESDWTGLQAAALGGCLDVVQYLLDSGVDVNARGADPECPPALPAALYGGHANIAQLLLERGVDVNAQGGGYPTALQSALYGGHNDIARSILEQEADVNAQGEDSEYPTALQSALYGGSADIAWTLLDRGADVNAQGGGYPSALQYAISGGYMDIEKHLLENGAVNIQGTEDGMMVCSSELLQDDGARKKRPRGHMEFRNNRLTFPGPYPIESSVAGCGGDSSRIGGAGGAAESGGRGGRSGRGRHRRK